MEKGHFITMVHIKYLDALKIILCGKYFHTIYIKKNEKLIHAQRIPDKRLIAIQ